MANVDSMRHRAPTKHHIAGIEPVEIREDDDGMTESFNGKLHNHKLHASVWLRFVTLVAMFTIFTLSLSRASRSVGSKPILDNGRINPLFVTIVMPSVVNPDARPHRLANIAKTWGPSARAIYVVHSANEYPEGNDFGEESTFPKILLVPDHITVDQGVPRLEHVIRTVYNQVNPDFSFFVNDHTFVLPFNLCEFVRKCDSSIDLYAGHALKGKDEVAFNSGAAGYVLSRSTMAKLINEWNKPNSKCIAENASKWHQGNPGILMAECFGRVLDIPVVDTRDTDDLSHKFHAYGIIRTITANFDKWYLNKHEALDSVLRIDTKYHHELQVGENCCSSSTVSFHYVEAKESLAMWDVLRTIRDSPISDADIKEYMYKHWPTDQKELGFYAHGLPVPEHVIWNELTRVIRKISVGVSPPSLFCK